MIDLLMARDEINNNAKRGKKKEDSTAAYLQPMQEEKEEARSTTALLAYALIPLYRSEHHACMFLNLFVTTLIFAQSGPDACDRLTLGAVFLSVATRCQLRRRPTTKVVVALA